MVGVPVAVVLLEVVAEPEAVLEPDCEDVCDAVWVAEVV